VTPAGGGLRLSQVASKGAVRVGGLERLRVLEEIAHHARGLRVYAAPDGEANAWELLVDGARFHLVISPEVWRGFSGEGQVLHELADEPGQRAVQRVRKALHWEPRLEVERLSRECELDRGTIMGALARLGASGLVGFDLSERAYFHRELPFDLSLIEALQPRLRDARKLVDEDGVRIASRGEAGIEAWVKGTGVEHRVRLTPEGARCTCPWYSKHQGDRGPCKHVLAVQITTGDPDEV
jgi:hypothetical protein